jgi:hypothetical protein
VVRGVCGTCKSRSSPSVPLVLMILLSGDHGKQWVGGSTGNVWTLLSRLSCKGAVHGMRDDRIFSSWIDTLHQHRQKYEEGDRR